MTRINDHLLDCVIYLYPSAQQAQRGERAGGTGFLVGIPVTAAPGRSFVYAVTNSHVIREGASPVVRLNTTDGVTEVWPFTPEQWLHHPDGDDLTVTILPGLDPQRHRWQMIGLTMLVSRADLEKYNIGPGDDVIMVGRFIGHDGRQRNAPSVRFGHISMMPGEPIRNGRGIDQESFLVETRSLGGYSGSPVFTFQPGPPRGTVLLRNAETEQMPDFLLGVDWGHLPITERVSAKDGTNLAEGWLVKSNSGQMAVVPAWRLRELLESEPLAKMRQLSELLVQHLGEQGISLPTEGQGPSALTNQWMETLKRIAST